jgi:hypothetical protein
MIESRVAAMTGAVGRAALVRSSLAELRNSYVREFCNRLQS